MSCRAASTLESQRRSALARSAARNLSPRNTALKGKRIVIVDKRITRVRRWRGRWLRLRSRRAVRWGHGSASSAGAPNGSLASAAGALGPAGAGGCEAGASAGAPNGSASSAAKSSRRGWGPGPAGPAAAKPCVSAGAQTDPRRPPPGAARRRRCRRCEAGAVRRGTKRIRVVRRPRLAPPPTPNIAEHLLALLGDRGGRDDRPREGAARRQGRRRYDHSWQRRVLQCLAPGSVASSPMANGSCICSSDSASATTPEPNGCWPKSSANVLGVARRPTRQRVRRPAEVRLGRAVRATRRRTDQSYPPANSTTHTRTWPSWSGEAELTVGPTESRASGSRCVPTPPAISARRGGIVRSSTDPGLGSVARPCRHHAASTRPPTAIPRENRCGHLPSIPNAALPGHGRNRRAGPGCRSPRPDRSCRTASKY